MAGDAYPGAQRVHAELRKAVVDLSERGLLVASRWAAELAVSVGATLDPREPMAVGGGREPMGDLFLLGKAHFDMKEYKRAAHTLRADSSPCGRFLRFYSLFLAGGKRQEEERVEQAGPVGRANIPNRELRGIQAELEAIRGAGTLDAFCTYLLGLVLKERDLKDSARRALAESLHAYPWNWSAWMELIALCETRESLQGIQLPNHWMRDFFSGQLALELQENEDALRTFGKLRQRFPNCSHVATQIAQAKYNMRDFDEAQSEFEAIQKDDPYRLDGMDIYSNILYVKECKRELSRIAHMAHETDKFRPETCCIIGNYYSLKANHEQAVEYFRRALKLTQNYLSAWTLMGHEYVELKNTSAAIEAYRRAVDINPRDYRAWYGLGQTYEILLMHYYALYYYRKATTIRPYDARMWCALGNCYEMLGRDVEALKCYERAVGNKDREGIALKRLAALNGKRGDSDMAAFFHRKNLERLEQEGVTEGQGLTDSLNYLAKYCRDKAQLQEAEKYCTRWLDQGPDGEKDDARALLREIRQLMIRAGTPSTVGITPLLPFSPL